MAVPALEKVDGIVKGTAMKTMLLATTPHNGDFLNLSLISLLPESARIRSRSSFSSSSRVLSFASGPAVQDRRLNK